MSLRSVMHSTPYYEKVTKGNSVTNTNRNFEVQVLLGPISSPTLRRRLRYQPRLLLKSVAKLSTYSRKLQCPQKSLTPLDTNYYEKEANAKLKGQGYRGTSGQRATL